MHTYFLLIKNVKLVETKIVQKHGKYKELPEEMELDFLKCNVVWFVFLSSFVFYYYLQ